ncbi:MAG TPA: hypothetical protein VNE38_05205 [Ktedonobacteraceae bacterium]|nr:hypothetical protein [Ktedonobacteraceae bacterium]
MTEEDILGKIAYEARRAFYYETRMDCIKPWDALDDETKQSFIASGRAVAAYIKRDLAGKQFSAFVASGGMEIEQQLAELQARQQGIEQELQELQEKLHHADTSTSAARI